MTTIQQLRSVGWRIRVNHYRYYQEVDTQIYLKQKMEKLKNDKLFQKGGETRLEITDLDGNFDYESSICRPDFKIENGKITNKDEKGHIIKGDPYNRKLGVKIALGRYLKRNGLSDKAMLKNKYYRTSLVV